jgi:hypothetical protein
MPSCGAPAQIRESKKTEIKKPDLVKAWPIRSRLFLYSFMAVPPRKLENFCTIEWIFNPA